MEKERETGSGASVYVVTADGEIVPGAEYVLKGVAGGGGTRRLQKEGAQIGPARDGRVWVAPRVAFEDLLAFYDVNVWHRRSCIVKALLTAGLGWQLVRGDAARAEVVYDPAHGGPVPDDPAARLLARPNANRLETFDALVYRFLVDFAALGNGFLEVARDRTGRPAELYHAPGRTMRRGAQMDRYWQVKNGIQRPFGVYGDPAAHRAGRNEILHLFAYDPRDDYYGMPDWFAALGAMGLDRTIIEYNTRLFANGLMANFAVVVTGGRLPAEGRTAIQRFIQDQAMGVRNAGRILLIEDEDDRMKIEFKPLNLELKQLIIREVQDHFRDVVVGAHGVPPRILGIVTPGQLGATGEVEGQLRTFRETVLRPGKRALESTLNVMLDEVSPGVRIRFSEMDITDIQSDGAFYERMIRALVYRPDEVRGLIDAGVSA